MKQTKHILALALLLLTAAPALAQQEALYSQYLANKLVLNPAYAGSREQLSIVLQGRRQWAGFAGAPSTEAVSLHFPTPDLRHGVGLTLVNDRWGQTSTTLFAANYAYRIPMGEEGSLSLGLKAGLRSYRIGFRDVPLQDEGDQAFNNGANFSKGQLVVAPGVYFQNRLWYAGLSLSDVVGHKLYDPEVVTDGARTSRHLFAMAGAALPLGEAVKLRPSVLVRAVSGAPVGLDLTLMGSFKDRIAAGATWRPGSAMALQLQCHVTNFIYLGYAYDISLGSTRTFATGGHELLLGFDLNFLQLDIPSPKPF